MKTIEAIQKRYKKIRQPYDVSLRKSSLLCEGFTEDILRNLAAINADNLGICPFIDSKTIDVDSAINALNRINKESAVLVIDDFTFAMTRKLLAQGLSDITLGFITDGSEKDLKLLNNILSKANTLIASLPVTFITTKDRKYIDRATFQPDVTDKKYNIMLSSAPYSKSMYSMLTIFNAIQFDVCYDVQPHTQYFSGCDYRARIEYDKRLIYKSSSPAYLLDGRPVTINVVLSTDVWRKEKIDVMMRKFYSRYIRTTKTVKPTWSRKGYIAEEFVDAWGCNSFTYKKDKNN